MSMLMALALAGAAQGRVLPEVDRRALELQARAESLQPRATAPRRSSPNVSAARDGVARATTLPTRTISTPVPVRQAQSRSPIRPASASTSLDLASITTICRAAGNQADPSNFLATLSRAYAMSSNESTSLRTSCAAYLAGRADARAVESAPAH